jgi:hypothetical protein
MSTREGSGAAATATGTAFRQSVKGFFTMPTGEYQNQYAIQDKQGDETILIVLDDSAHAREAE